MSRLALGTVQFGIDYGVANKDGQVSPNEINKILAYAKGKGIETLDTAVAYGESEKRLGSIGVNDWQIVSKLPPVKQSIGNISDWVECSVTESLNRLRIKKLYGLLLHRPQQLLEQDGEQLYLALKNLKLKGTVQKIGVSIYDPSELDVLCSRYDFDLVQAPFNILDRRLETSGWLSRFAELDIELHVRSVFLQGLLLMSTKERPIKFGRWHDLWTKWDRWLLESNMTAIEACLQFILSFDEVSKVVVGVDNLKQLHEIFSASEGSLSGIPASLSCNDIDLINPSKWSEL